MDDTVASYLQLFDCVIFSFNHIILDPAVLPQSFNKLAQPLHFLRSQTTRTVQHRIEVLEARSCVHCDMQAQHMIKAAHSLA